MLRGTGVSEGCGIGKALIIQHRSLGYSGVVFGGAQQEKERLRAAINAFMQKTEQLRDRLQASAGEKEAAILDGHMEMLRDPFMLSQMEEMIDGGATAEAAADGVCNQFIAMFSGMDDELTRQRASDIADVREDLLGIMLGAEQVDLGAIEPGTVLAGDYLLATSLVHAEQTNNYEIIRLVSSLGQKLAEGELLQLSNVSNHSFSEEVYFDVIRKKTAALFAACAEAAALSVQVGEEEVAFARLLGEYIGICFQIKDDIFDYFDSKKIGKPTGNDMLEGKLTLPALYALNTTKDAWAEQIAFKVKEGTATPDEIVRLIEFTKDNGGIEYACRTIEQYKKKAFDLLAALPDSNICLALRTYLDYVVAREK